MRFPCSGAFSASRAAPRVTKRGSPAGMN
jgi:hypothetical protein